MAAQIRSWQCDSQEHGVANAMATARQPDQRPHVPVDKPGAVLYDWFGGVLLGIHRRRGEFSFTFLSCQSTALTTMEGDMRRSLDFTQARS
jgi:hypothetical protein